MECALLFLITSAAFESLTPYQVLQEPVRPICHQISISAALRDSHAANGVGALQNRYILSCLKVSAYSLSCHGTFLLKGSDTKLASTDWLPFPSEAKHIDHQPGT